MISDFVFPANAISVFLYVFGKTHHAYGGSKQIWTRTQITVSVEGKTLRMIEALGKNLEAMNGNEGLQFGHSTSS